MDNIPVEGRKESISYEFDFIDLRVEQIFTKDTKI